MSLDIGPAQSDRAIYLAALDVVDESQRQAFLEQACAGDAARRREIGRLLAAHDAHDANPVDRAMKQLGPAETRGPEADAAVEFDIAAHPTIDRYKLLEQIGAGGMGTVFMAQQTELIRQLPYLRSPPRRLHSKIFRFSSGRFRAAFRIE